MVQKYPKIYKYVLYPAIFLALMVFLLNISGRLFIKEISYSLPAEGGATETSVSELKNAPYFELYSPNGKLTKFSDILGKPTILAFWNNWGVDSLSEIKVLNDVYKANKEIFFIFAVSSQEEKREVDSVERRGGYEIPFLIDTSGSVTDLYEARNQPFFVFIDKSGRIAETYSGTLSGEEIVDKMSKYVN